MNLLHNTMCTLMVSEMWFCVCFKSIVIHVQTGFKQIHVTNLMHTVETATYLVVVPRQCLYYICSIYYFHFINFILLTAFKSFRRVYATVKIKNFSYSLHLGTSCVYIIQYFLFIPNIHFGILFDLLLKYFQL